MVWRGVVSVLGIATFAISVLHAAPSSEPIRVVGRVRVTPIPETGSDLVRAALGTRYAPVAGKRFADARVISVRPRQGDPSRFEATIYDYGVEKAFDLVLDGRGKELSRKPLDIQPARSTDEYADAVTIVREYAAFAELIASGVLTPYDPMPSISVDREGHRLVNIGVMSSIVTAQTVEKNEIVSVHIPTGRVIRYPTGAPDTARATLGVCGPAITNCGAAIGTCGTAYQVQWPAASPVWKFKVRHPSCTTSIQPDATGLELTDVYYQGRLILKRAEVPVLNVKYVGDNCGPFRDYLDSEDCFQAAGTDVPAAGSGIRVASSEPSTFCETGVDAGNFRGVAIFDEGDQLWLMTESKAGWYRYVMEWRLHLDGTIEPIFGFGAVSNGCTCYEHFHHVYWRFEWAIDAVSNGTTDDPATGINTLERRHPGSTTVYDPINNEGTFLRPINGGDQDFFRVKNAATGNGYLIEPGLLDGNANGDTYGKWDFAALALNASQINDNDSSDTSINVSPWLNNEALGATKRLVTWYHATYNHDDPNGTGESCELAGPKLVPVGTCSGDCTAPTFSNVQAAPGTGSVTVTWNTNEAATSVVHYGTSIPPTSTGSAAGMTTSHSVPISGLAGCTTYTYSVESADGSGNTGVNDNGGSYFTFTTGAQGSFTSTDTPKPIPDQNATGVTSTIAVGATGTVQDANVTVNVTHPFDADLTLSLISPTNTTVTLSARRGASGDNFTNTVFDDEAATSIASGSPPFTGSFRPEGLLSSVDGISAAGDWKLKATDLGVDDIGTIDSWTLNLTYAGSCGPSPAPPPVPDATTASLSTPSRIHLTWDASTCTAGSYHVLYGSLAGVSSYAVDGSVCGLGILGSFDWNNFPVGDIWFLVVPGDTGSTEGSWGTNHAGAQRNGAIASGTCGFTSRDNSGTCP